MAYVVWRVFMKKYSKVRLGIQRNPNIVVSLFYAVKIIIINYNPATL